MFVMTGVPYFACPLTARSEGVATLDVLNAFCGGLIDGGSYQNVDVIGHDDETVELETALIAITEERCYE
jgi:hypothetical protein